MNKRKILTLAICLSLLVSCFAIFKEKGNVNVYALTGGNPNYSLEGAVYQVYTKDSNGNFTVPATDTSGENAVFVTDAEGNVEPCDLKVEEYKVQEVTPSKGYLLDPNIYPITVKDGETASFTSIEMPTVGKMPEFLRKVDPTGQYGHAVLVGANLYCIILPRKEDNYETNKKISLGCNYSSNGNDDCVTRYEHCSCGLCEETRKGFGF